MLLAPCVRLLNNNWLECNTQVRKKINNFNKIIIEMRREKFVHKSIVPNIKSSLQIHWNGKCLCTNRYALHQKQCRRLYLYDALHNVFKYVFSCFVYVHIVWTCVCVCMFVCIIQLCCDFINSIYPNIEQFTVPK